MSKFKVGDTVRILSQANCIPYDYIGCKGVIISDCDDGTYQVSAKANNDDEKQDWYYNEDRLEKWEEETMNRPKFKVGDKVKVVRSGEEFGHVRGSWAFNMERYVNNDVIYTIRDVYCENKWETIGYRFKEDDKFVWDERLLKLVSYDYEITIKCIDGKHTIAKTVINGKTYRAKASCAPEDEFDFTVGAILAMSRLKEKIDADTKTFRVVCIDNIWADFRKGKIYTVIGKTIINDLGKEKDFDGDALIASFIRLVED